MRSHRSTKPLGNPLLSTTLLLSVAGISLHWVPVAAGEPEETGFDTISVTATRIERATREVPSAVNVIDSDQIEGSRMMNIKDAIQGTPGVLIDSKNGGYDVRLIV
ncbi:MAG: TonB-dependent receptor plug domain-containing protein, partial [Gammaproteobacteria bacterium]|nr:TonB-dependent receptor plug domain-containing protein [Gammaproteobacteria bacterium]